MKFQAQRPPACLRPGGGFGPGRTRTARSAGHPPRSSRNASDLRRAIRERRCHHDMLGRCGWALPASSGHAAAHWAVHDPLRRHFFAHREDRELLDVCHILRARIERLLPLLLAGVEQDRLHLGRELERIGRFLP